MRKTISSLIVLSIVALLIAPAVFAQVTPPGEVTGCNLRHDLTNFNTHGFNCPMSGSCPFENAAGVTSTCGACCVLDTIYTVTDWIFYIVFAIAIIFIILGALTIVTAGGSPEKVTTGRNYILYAVIGVIIALAAKGIPAIARAILGV